ncbi:MAG: hypothetical protein ACFB0C_24530 [Leptolyngbyaceae cyanobacterium]
MARRSRQSLSQTLLWLNIRDLGEFSLTRLQRLANVSYREVYRYTQELIKGGYIDELGEAPQDRAVHPIGRGPNIYRLVRDTGPKPVRYYLERDELIDPNLPDCPTSDPMDRCWQAIRIYGQRFTAAQIEEVADLKHRECLDYLRRFIKCGYVRKLSPPTRPPVYRLIRNSGPLCPMFSKGGSCFDPNTQERHEPDQPLT